MAIGEAEHWAFGGMEACRAFVTRCAQDTGAEGTQRGWVQQQLNTGLHAPDYSQGRVGMQAHGILPGTDPALRVCCCRPAGAAGAGGAGGGSAPEILWQTLRPSRRASTMVAIMVARRAAGGAAGAGAQDGAVPPQAVRVGACGAGPVRVVRSAGQPALGALLGKHDGGAEIALLTCAAGAPLCRGRGRGRGEGAPAAEAAPAQANGDASAAPGV